MQLKGINDDTTHVTATMALGDDDATERGGALWRAISMPTAGARQPLPRCNLRGASRCLATLPDKAPVAVALDLYLPPLAELVIEVVAFYPL